jgi:dTDP-4-amino-4,6-dideoxygalactose transaminase
MIKYVDLARSNKAIHEEIMSEIEGSIKGSSFLRGKHTQGFEEEWAAFCGQSFAVACNSGTDALTIAASALNISSAVIPANTLPLTGIGVARSGARVKISEVNDDGWMEDDSASAVPVLLFGRLPPKINSDVRLYDAAHAHGWQPPYSAVAAWSFYPTKTLGAMGDAGAVTLNDSALADEMRDICGRDDQMRNARQITSRIDEVQAAVLRVKLKYLGKHLSQRQEIAESYDSKLAQFGITLTGKSMNHIYAIRTPKRDELKTFLEEAGIQTKIHWEIPLNRSVGPWSASGEFKNADRWASEILSLPIYPGLMESEIIEICEKIEAFLTI